MPTSSHPVCGEEASRKGGGGGGGGGKEGSGPGNSPLVSSVNIKATLELVRFSGAFYLIRNRLVSSWSSINYY